MIDPKLLDEYREISQLAKQPLNRQLASGLLSKLLKKLLDRAYPAFINYFDFSSSSVTDITQQNVYKKLACTTTSLFDWETFEHTNNRVTNTGYAKNVKLEGIVSLQAPNNEELHAAFFKNDSIIPCSEQSVVSTSGDKANDIAFQSIITLEPNEYVEVWVKNATAAGDITLHSINVIVTEL